MIRGSNKNAFYFVNRQKKMYWNRNFPNFIITNKRSFPSANINLYCIYEWGYTTRTGEARKSIFGKMKRLFTHKLYRNISKRCECHCRNFFYEKLSPDQKQKWKIWTLLVKFVWYSYTNFLEKHFCKIDIPYIKYDCFYR